MTMQIKKVILSKDETYNLLSKSHSGCLESREKLVISNLRLVYKAIKKYTNKGYPLDDLFQIGTIGLLKSIDKFDTSFNVAFSTYAIPMIRGELQRFFRDDSIVKISRSIRTNLTTINKFSETYFQDHNKKPRPEEISKALNMDYDDVLLALQVSHIGSVDDIIFENDGDPITLLDTLVGDSDPYRYLALKEAIQKLDKRSKKIVDLRYFKDKTQSEVAKIIGVTQVQISRLESRIMSDLKNQLEGNSNVIYLPEIEIKPIPEQNIIIEEIIEMAKTKIPRLKKEDVFKLFEKGYQKKRIMEETGMALGSFYNYKRQFNLYKEELKTQKVDNIVKLKVSETLKTAVDNLGMVKNTIITVDIIVKDGSIIKDANIFHSDVQPGSHCIQDLDEIDSLFRKIPTIWKGKFINFQTEYFNGTIHVNNVDDYKVNITQY